MVFYLNVLKGNLELIFWLSALILLAFLVPSGEHFTLCLFKNLGIDFCPGCGIGRSIHHAMMLDLGASFNTHPFGILALIAIINRIYQLVKRLIKNHE